MASVWIAPANVPQQVDYGPGSFSQIGPTAAASLQGNIQPTFYPSTQTANPVQQAPSQAPGPGQNGYVNPNSIQRPSDDQLNAIYNPAFASIDAASANLQNNLYPNQLANIDTLGQAQQSDLQTKQDQEDALTKTQQQNLNDTTQSAYDQAAQNFRYITQGNQNMYGYNGAYLGANAMAQSEAARESGLIGQNQQVTLRDLLTQQQAVHQDILNQSTKAAQWVVQQKADAKTQLNDQLAQLAQARFGVEADRAKAALQITENYDNTINQIYAQQQQFNQALQLYQQQQQAAINSSYNAMIQNQQQTLNNGLSAFSPVIQGSNFNTSTPNQGNSYSVQSTSFVPQSNTNDPYAQLTSPAA